MRSPPEDHQLPPKTRTKKKLRGKSSDLLGWFSFEDVWHEPTMMHLPLGSDSREFQDEEINSVLISKIRLEKVGWLRFAHWIKWCNDKKSLIFGNGTQSLDCKVDWKNCLWRGENSFFCFVRTYLHTYLHTYIHTYIPVGDIYTCGLKLGMCAPGGALFRPKNESTTWNACTPQVLLFFWKFEFFWYRWHAFFGNPLTVWDTWNACTWNAWHFAGNMRVTFFDACMTYVPAICMKRCYTQGLHISFQNFVAKVLIWKLFMLLVEPPFAGWFFPFKRFIEKELNWSIFKLLVFLFCWLPFPWSS